MTYYAALDVSLKETSICIVDERRKVMKEGKVDTEREAIAASLVSRRRSSRSTAWMPGI